MSIIIFLIILGLLVLVHELGHFFIAKRVGILVEEFGFGFPPRLWSQKIGETIYSINLIPFGGFVKLYGEEQQELAGEKNVKINRTFFAKKPGQKTAVILGGVLMNTILAVIIYYFLLSANGFQSEPLPLFRSYHFRFGRQEGRVVVAGVLKNTPAYLAGIKEEDIILKFKLGPPNSQNNWTTILSGNQLIQKISLLNHIPITIQFYNLKNGTTKILTITPVYDKKLGRAVIGVQLVDSVIIKYLTPRDKIFSGFFHSYNILVYNLKTFAYLFQSAYKQGNVQIVSQSVSGPIGIFAIIQDLVKTSQGKFFINFFNVLAALSLSLALVNVFPFPALDGGRMIFIVYELIFRKPISKKIEYYINYAGFAILLFLAALISISDIFKLIK